MLILTAAPGVLARNEARYPGKSGRHCTTATSKAVGLAMHRLTIDTRVHRESLQPSLHPQLGGEGRRGVLESDFEVVLRVLAEAQSAPYRSLNSRPAY